MIDNFSLERVNKAPASFDPKKLWSFQDHYMQELSIDQKVAMTLPYLERAGVVETPATEAVRAAAASDRGCWGTGSRWRGISWTSKIFFIPDERLAYDEAAFEKLLGDVEAAQRLAHFATGWPRPKVSIRRRIEHCCKNSSPTRESASARSSTPSVWR